MKTYKNLGSEIELLHLAEKLKFELRHSWMSQGRQESVAEHSWRLALMVMLYSAKIQPPFDSYKALKMAIIHDLVEAQAGDIPVFDLDQKTRALKARREQQAIENIRDILRSDLGCELYDLWQEFEAGVSKEARMVFALDKLECKLQHLEAPLDTWNEKELALSFDWEDELYDIDPVILELKNRIYQHSFQKVEHGKSSS